MPDSRKLSILQVCSATQAVYGAVQSLMTLASAQQRQGHRVEFLTFKGKPFGSQVREAGFGVREIRVRTKIDLQAVVQMRSFMLEGCFDIVHTHLSTSSVNGAIAARLARIPSVATVHGMSGKLSFSAANHLIAVSKRAKEHLLRQGVSPSRVSVVYNGLDYGFTGGDRCDVRRELGLSNSHFVLGTVSRITPMKGVEYALQAFAKLAGTHAGLRYLVVGEGDALESCRALARQLGIADKVIFAGYKERVGRYLAAMDLFLFPSLKEAMGIALVEAMALGLPIVATDVGGIPEVLDSSCGIMVGARSAEALADATAGLLAAPERMAELGRRALERQRTMFSPETMERDTEKIYRQLIGPRTGDLASVPAGITA